MSLDAYRRIDVDVFKDIMESEFFTGGKNENDNFCLTDMVRKICTVELRVPGIDSDIKKEAAKIKYRQYGFRTKADFKIDFRQDIFENETIIFLIPQKAYELENVIKKMPVPYCEKGKKLSLLLADSFERLKVKSKNILQNSGSDEQITHYAKKNIQVAIRNCYDARLLLVKTQETKDRYEIFQLFIANLYMIYALTYLTKMFSSYYTDSKDESTRQKIELFDIMDLSLLIEPKPEHYQNKEPEEPKSEIILPQFKWNLPVNVMASLIYDLKNKKTEDDLPVLEADNKDIQNILSMLFVDKNGKALNKTTVGICLNEDREDKRAKGKRRIDISNYLN